MNPFTVYNSEINLFEYKRQDFRNRTEKLGHDCAKLIKYSAATHEMLIPLDRKSREMITILSCHAIP